MERITPDDRQIKAMSEEDIRHLVRESVRQNLEAVGFEVGQPSSLQADMLYLRRLRKGSDEIRGVLLRSVLTILATTALFLLWEAIKGQVK